VRLGADQHQLGRVGGVVRAGEHGEGRGGHARGLVELDVVDAGTVRREQQVLPQDLAAGTV